MSSVGQAVGGIVGGVVGFFTPLGPVYGAQIGMMVGGVLDPPRTEGPRLEDLTTQTSVYGAFIPRLYGTTAVTGNVLWIQGDKLIEHSVESGGKGGPVVTNFEYFATFAVGLCEGPIDGVRRIWIGGQLWYDAGSDDLSTIIASNEAAALFTIYTGTDTQLADPLIQADRGAANVPAYRGLAYIVFDELPLKDYGNSLAAAQVKVEVVANGVVSPVALPPVTIANYPMEYYPRPVLQYGKSVVIGAKNGVLSFYAYDLFAGDYTDAEGFHIPNDEVSLTVSIGGEFLGQNTVPLNVVRPQIVSNGNFAFQAGILGNSQVWATERGALNPIGSAYSIIPYGDLENQGTPSVSGSRGDLAQLLPGELGRTVTGLACAGDGSGVLITTRGTGVTDRYFIMDASLNIIDSGSVGAGFNGGFGDVSFNGVVSLLLSDTLDFGWRAQGSATFGIDVLRFTIDPDHVLRVGATFHVVRNANTQLAVAHYGGVFFVLSHNTAIGNAVLLAFTDSQTIAPNTVALSTIVESECLQSDLLTAGDLDVTELTDQVRGYRISSLSPLRGGIDQLRKAWPFDAIQHGYKILFKKRGGASVATITEGELDAREAGASPGVRISNVREMDLIMPQQLTVQYLDAAREYDVNVAEESR